MYQDYVYSAIIYDNAITRVQSGRLNDASRNAEHIYSKRQRKYFHQPVHQCSRICIIRILFYEKYVRIFTYFSYSYVKKRCWLQSASIAVLILQSWFKTRKQNTIVCLFHCFNSCLCPGCSIITCVTKAYSLLYSLADVCIYNGSFFYSSAKNENK